MPQTTAERIVTRLGHPDLNVAHEAARRLQWGNFKTIDQVLAAIDDGAFMHTQVAADLAGSHRIDKQVRKRWNMDTVFRDDAHFSSARLALIVRPRLAFLRMEQEDWDAFTGQMRRMWRAGRLKDTYVFLDYAWTAIIMKDKKFAIELLAHTDYDQEYVAYKANFHSNVAAKFVLKNWQHVEATRQKLFEQVWLKGQLPQTEWQEMKRVPKPLLRDLYGHLREGGYNAYAQHVAVQV